MTAAAWRHIFSCREGLALCEYPRCYPMACATCGGDLPEFPAFIYTDGIVTGPFCDDHAVLTASPSDASYADPLKRPKDAKGDS